jgi:hypothetical protein
VERARQKVIAKKKGAHQGVIYCNGAGGGANGWSFPKPIERKLQREFAGLKILQMFGGRATFGLRMDIDPTVEPDLIADAWMPPFAKNTFDVVILDPPYASFGRHFRYTLGVNAAHIARRYVVWFSSFAATSLPGCSIDRWWTVIVGNDSSVRQLAFFRPRADKRDPEKHYMRGPAMKYNRWSGGQQIGLALR